MENSNLNKDSDLKTGLDTQKGKQDDKQNEWHDHADTDKYLALEQEGVTFTDTPPTTLSDNNENGEQGTGTWEAEGQNSRNSDAFNQDDYLLNDNIDLDEDQNQSISSDDV